MTCRSHDAGFTLIETLLSTALLLLILTLLASVTTQWLPNWNRGFAVAQRNEHLALGLERIVADLSAAEFIQSAGEPKRLMFDGTITSIAFVRSAVGPNTQRGVEFVRLAEIGDDRGPMLVRATAPFVPLPAVEGELGRLRFAEPVVLVRQPYRVQFAFAGADRQWRTVWQDADRLPSAIRVTVRDGITGRTLQLSTAARIHVNAPAECAVDTQRECPPRPQANPDQPQP
jgi:general secretion pathway protein J